MPGPGLRYHILIMTFKETESEAQRGWAACPELRTWQQLADSSLNVSSDF